MFLSVARGTTNLVEACGYLAVGTLYGGYAEAWAFWAVQMLFSVGTLEKHENHEYCTGRVFQTLD